MENLTKEQLLGIIEWAQNELELITKIEKENQPIRGKNTVGYYCQKEKGVKKWKVEFKGKHFKWVEHPNEVFEIIKFLG
jgi:hypothetical protein